MACIAVIDLPLVFGDPCPLSHFIPFTLMSQVGKPSQRFWQPIAGPRPNLATCTICNNLISAIQVILGQMPWIRSLVQ